MQLIWLEERFKIRQNIWLKKKKFTKNLDDLLNYNGDENSNFNENNKKFEDLLKSIGYGNGDSFEVNFNPWGED